VAAAWRPAAALAGAVALAVAWLCLAGGFSIIVTIVGLEGLAGACCGTKVVLLDAPGLFRLWCCGGDGKLATTMTMSGW
jgi:hypothetical protein